LQVPPKFTQISIFGLKICRLATLLPIPVDQYFDMSRSKSEPIKPLSSPFEK
jgi:hypothetical protein